MNQGSNGLSRHYLPVLLAAEVLVLTWLLACFTALVWSCEDEVLALANPTGCCWSLGVGLVNPAAWSDGLAARLAWSGVVVFCLANWAAESNTVLVELFPAVAWNLTCARRLCLNITSGWGFIFEVLNHSVLSRLSYSWVNTIHAVVWYVSMMRSKNASTVLVYWGSHVKFGPNEGQISP